MKNKETLIIIASVIILLLLGGGAYWYFFMQPVTVHTNGTGSTTTTGGFHPFGNTNTPAQVSTSSSSQNGSTGTSGSTTSETPITSTLAALRLLSTTPVGGYGASTTAKTTIVRWVDRGRGNVYEAGYDSPTVTTLSNTVVPRIYESVWNRNLTAFIGSMFQEGDATWSAVYSQLIPSGKVSSSSDVTPFALRGKKLPSTLVGYATSPKKDKLFMFTNESGVGTGYTSNLDGSGVTQIFTTPLTQVNVAWPSDNYIAITTKGSANYSGYMYFVNPKTGAWTKILGPVLGLSTSVSHDAKYVLWSGTGRGGSINAGIYTVSKATSVDAGVTTLADKCAWGNVKTTYVYCGVPSSLTSATYPDDWYQGKVSSSDKIWQIDAATGAVNLMSSLVDQSDRVIDAYNLSLSSKDNYLFFINKNDLSLWSLELSGN